MKKDVLEVLKNLAILILKIKLALIGIALSLSPLVLADDSLAFENISAKGSGCPDGSTAIVFSPDRKTVSLLFSDMVAEVPQFDGDNENDEAEATDRLSRHNKNMARKVCLVKVEADVMPGHQVTEVEISSDFRGLTVMDKGTTASFKSSFLQWRGGVRGTKKIGQDLAKIRFKSGEVDEDWFESKSVTFPIESSCRDQRKNNLQFVLKNVVIARILKKARDTAASAFISLDSADLSGVLKLKLKTKKCADSGEQRLSREEILRRRRGLPGNNRRPRMDRGQRCPRGSAFDRRLGRCRRR